MVTKEKCNEIEQRVLEGISVCSRKRKIKVAPEVWGVIQNKLSGRVKPCGHSLCALSSLAISEKMIVKGPYSTHPEALFSQYLDVPEAFIAGFVHAFDGGRDMSASLPVGTKRDYSTGHRLGTKIKIKWKATQND